jgi:predicted RNA binding protein YcfA (HicA-like mRNA interferase family)
MRQYTHREFVKILIANGFYYDRHNGDHAIYLNDAGRHISIPMKLESVIARRLIKENSLEIDIKKLKKLKKMSLNEPDGASVDARNPDLRTPEINRVVVAISQTLSTTAVVEIEGEYDESDLKRAVREQIFLPSDCANSSGNKETWTEDDFEVIEE